MTAALPPPSRTQPPSSSGQSRRTAAATATPAPSAPARWAAASPARRPARSITRETATAAIPEPSTSSASGSPAVAASPVMCSASSAPAVPPAARPNAPSSCAATSTRMVRRCSSRGGGDGGWGTGGLLRDRGRAVALPASRSQVLESNTRSGPIHTLELSIQGGSGRHGMADELDPRLLRHFVAVAEELHFTRAAARLYLAQQALSRDISRLERQLGVRLFTRTTRRVALTPEGERLLVRARELLALHHQTLRELHDLDPGRPLLVDLLAEGHSPTRVLRAARQRAPRSELVARFHGGFGAALAALLAGRLDVAFGRSEGLGQPFPTEQLARRLVRLEPLALLLPEEHPLAALDEVPLAALRGTQVDASSGNDQAPEWVDLAVQLLAAFGAEASPAHLHAVGLARGEGWRRRPPGAWLPEADAATLGLGGNAAGSAGTRVRPDPGASP